MNDSDHETMVRSVEKGQMLLGIDRIYARKLFVDVPMSIIEQSAGETPYLEKAIVWFAFLGTYVSIIGSFVAAILAFYLWSLIAIPAAIIAWLVTQDRSVRGGATVLVPTAVLVAAVVIYYTLSFPNPWIARFIVILAFSLWCNRLVYSASTFFLRAMVLRNSRAFSAFREGVLVRTVDDM